MSGIFGIYNRNNKPVDKAIFDTMLAGMSYWQPDDRGTWCHGPVALGHTMLWNTPESKFERLPDKQDVVVITMDGRLDNREELARQLAMSGRPLNQITDSSFILQSYRKWGEECPRHLLGDFAFAIWDEQKQQLFCARDHVGVKQFYFHLTDKLFVFANDLRGLVEHPDISQEINDEAVANFIVNNQLLSQKLTFFRDIEKLPPAHTLTVAAYEVQENCYWRLEDVSRVRFKDVDEYATKLRNLLEQAVHARVRTSYPVASHLSGGLDSSSVAVLAARKLQQKNKTLIGFNWLHEPQETDDPNHFEWRNSREIAAKERIEHHFVALNAEDMYRYSKEQNFIFGDTTGGWYENSVRTNAQRQGIRTILSGWGGDEFITYHGQSYYSDLLGSFKINKLVMELNCIAKQKQYNTKAILSFLYHKLIIPRLPRSWYCYVPKSICKDKSVSRLIAKDFVPVVKKEINKIQLLTAQPYPTIKQHMLAYYKYGHIHCRIDSWAASAMANCIEYSFPLLDKRIIEFAFGVPAEFFVENGVGRFLYKKASIGIVPHEMLWKDHKLELKRGDRLLTLYSEVFGMYKEELDTKTINSDFVDIAELKQVLSKTEFSSLKKVGNEIHQIMRTMTVLKLLSIDIC